MFSTLRNRFGIPGVISVVALVFAMFGGAYAASNGNSGNSSATASAKAKKGPRGPRGAKGATGPAGSQGPAGPQGPAGANGKDGAPGQGGATGTQGPTGPTGPTGKAGSPWTLDGTLPPGKTETGAWAFGPVPGGKDEEGKPITITTDETDFSLSFPVPLEEPLDKDHVHFVKEQNGGGLVEVIFNESFEPEEVTPVNCLGEPDAPTAPPGHLCVYSSAPLLGATIISNLSIINPGGGGEGAGQTGARVTAFETKSGSRGLGTFAVTAPTE